LKCHGYSACLKEIIIKNLFIIFTLIKMGGIYIWIVMFVPQNKIKLICSNKKNLYRTSDVYFPPKLSVCDSFVVDTSENKS